MTEYTTVPLRRCSICGESKPATTEFFYKKKREGRDGLDSRCISCFLSTALAKREAANPKLAARHKAEAEHPGMKLCPQCGNVKPATPEFFTRNKNTKNGLYPICKTCKGVDSANRYKASDKAKDRHARYRAENADKIALHDAARYIKNRDKIKVRTERWRSKNLDKVRVMYHRRRAAVRNLPATFTDADWLRCLEYFGYCCAYCGRPRGLWHTLAQDHYIPVTRGGGYTPGNIVPACHGVDGCNNKKSNTPPHKWLERTFGKRKAAHVERRIREYFDSLSID